MVYADVWVRRCRWLVPSRLLCRSSVSVIVVSKVLLGTRRTRFVVVVVVVVVVVPQQVLEPVVDATIITPSDCLGSMLTLLKNRRGRQTSLT